MRWPPWSRNSENESHLHSNPDDSKHPEQHPHLDSQDERQPQQKRRLWHRLMWTSSPEGLPATHDSNAPPNKPDWAAFTEVRTLIPTLILSGSIITLVRLHRRFLRRFPDANSISPSFFRQRSIFGQVTSVGDGDNFRLFHTPGGKWTGWGWLPWKRVPALKKDLKDKTVHVRLAGVDAPELAHFGRPEQPFAREAHTWLTNYLTHRTVHAHIHRQDQYQRVVASVYTRRALDFPIPFRRRDVSYELLKRGLATVYEAKFGAEFGGEATERRYRNAEWWAKFRRKGLWKDFENNEKDWESPRDYKTRLGVGEMIHHEKSEKGEKNGPGKTGNGKGNHDKNGK